MILRRTSNTYTGRAQAVILDWAGTAVDFGSCAPVAAIMEVFQRRGIQVTVEQARRPMGRHKREHLRAVCRMRAVAAQWERLYGQPCSEGDVDALFAEFLPRQIECAVKFAAPIPGVLDAVAAIRARGLKIGSTTGYPRDIMIPLAAEARRLGYAPDCMVCADDVPAGRPAPWMCYHNAIALQCYPLHTLVKIGDTPVDVEEGLNAGMWTVGLTRCGNEVGLTEAEFDALPPAIRRVKLAHSEQRLRHAGAHYVVETLADVLPVLDEIDKRLRRQERP